MVNRIGLNRFVFEVFLPRAQNVTVAGTFNQWSVDACPMARDADGWWRTTLTLADGDHSFQYVIDGHEWLADFAAGGVERNGFGCWVSLLSVDRTSRRQRTLDRELTAILDLVQDASQRLRDGASENSIPFPMIAGGTDDEPEEHPDACTIEALARMVA